MRTRRKSAKSGCGTGDLDGNGFGTGNGEWIGGAKRGWGSGDVVLKTLFVNSERNWEQKIEMKAQKGIVLGVLKRYVLKNWFVNWDRNGTDSELGKGNRKGIAKKEWFWEF